MESAADEGQFRETNSLDLLVRWRRCVEFSTLIKVSRQASGTGILTVEISEIGRGVLVCPFSTWAGDNVAHRPLATPLTRTCVHTVPRASALASCTRVLYDSGQSDETKLADLTVTADITPCRRRSETRARGRRRRARGRRGPVAAASGRRRARAPPRAGGRRPQSSSPPRRPSRRR